MGFNPATILLNLCLYNSLPLDTKKPLKNLQNARLFGNLFRFIDNLRAMKNYIEFNKNYKDFIHTNTKRDNHQLPRCILKVPSSKRRN